MFGRSWGAAPHSSVELTNSAQIRTVVTPFIWSVVFIAGLRRTGMAGAAIRHPRDLNAGKT